MAKELKRLNINMPLDLVSRVDEFAENMSINRSAAINVLLSLALDGKNALIAFEYAIDALAD